MFAMGPAFFGSGYATLALSGTFPAASVGVAYDQYLTISGGATPYSLSSGTGLASGSIPAGLSLSIASGNHLRLSGTPTAVGTNTFTVSVDSADSQTATSNQSIVTGLSDPNWANVVSLLNMGGAAGSTTFADAIGKTWTAGAGASISTTLGFNAARFTGSNGWITTPASSDFNFGSGDFTIRARVKVDALDGSHKVIWSYDNIGSIRGVLFYVDRDNGNKLSFYSRGNTTVSIVAASAFTTATTDVEVSRVGDTMYLFADGVLLGSADCTGHTTNNPNVVACVGCLVHGGVPSPTDGGVFNGYVQAIEVYKGVGLHTAGFTPDSPPWPTS